MSRDSGLASTVELVWAWTARTLRGRYQQSLLGWLWAVVQPAASVALFTVVFTRFVRVDTGDTPYAVFSYVAVVPWAFLAASLGDMTSSLVLNMTLIKRIYFPRHALPLAAMLARLMDAVVAALLLVGLFWFYNLELQPRALPWLVVIAAVQIVLVAGLGLGLASFNVFYRDAQPLVVLLTQLWFYASPVIYPVDAVPAGWRQVYAVNPMVGVLEGYRGVLLRGQAPGAELLTAAAVALLTLVAGAFCFRRLEPRFADVV